MIDEERIALEFIKIYRKYKDRSFRRKKKRSEVVKGGRGRDSNSKVTSRY